jgi:hypothetical protein
VPSSGSVIKARLCWAAALENQFVVSGEIPGEALDVVVRDVSYHERLVLFRWVSLRHKLPSLLLSGRLVSFLEVIACFDEECSELVELLVDG